MDALLESCLAFFTDNLPSPRMLVAEAPAGLGWAYACLYFAGRLKRDKGLRTGYTRKVFHFLIFGSVAAIQWVSGTRSVCLFGGMATAVISYAVWRGPGNLLYEAMAREKDEPHRTRYIVAPYFATLIGGIASNVLFGPFAVVGYLVTGLGDAIGEPFGTRFGKHTYRVPSLTSVRAVRSFEGSAAVLVMSLLAVAASVALSPELQFEKSYLFAVPLIAAAGALIEAVSPHGWDNATMQIGPAFLATLLL